MAERACDSACRLTDGLACAVLLSVFTGHWPRGHQLSRSMAWGRWPSGWCRPVAWPACRLCRLGRLWRGRPHRAWYLRGHHIPIKEGERAAEGAAVREGRSLVLVATLAVAPRGSDGRRAGTTCGSSGVGARLRTIALLAQTERWYERRLLLVSEGGGAAISIAWPWLLLAKEGVALGEGAANTREGSAVSLVQGAAGSGGCEHRELRFLAYRRADLRLANTGTRRGGHLRGGLGHALAAVVARFCTRGRDGDAKRVRALR